MINTHTPILSRARTLNRAHHTAVVAPYTHTHTQRQKPPLATHDPKCETTFPREQHDSSQIILEPARRSVRGSFAPPATDANFHWSFCLFCFCFWYTSCISHRRKGGWRQQREKKWMVAGKLHPLRCRWLSFRLYITTRSLAISR